MLSSFCVLIIFHVRNKIDMPRELTVLSTRILCVTAVIEEHIIIEALIQG